MSEPHADIEGGEAYKPIYDLLDKRRTLQESALGPGWLQKLPSIGGWLALVVAPAVAVVLGIGALAGWTRALVLYPLVLASFALFLGGAMALATVAVLLFCRVRSKTKGHKPTQVVVADCVFAERLAACSVFELRTLRHVLASRLDRFRERQIFVLGPAAKISPFLIVLVFLLLSKTEIVGAVTQIAPWATKVASSPLAAFSGCLVTFAIVLMRLWAHFEDENVSVNLMLIDGALERINSMKRAQGPHDEAATLTHSRVTAATPDHEALRFAPMSHAQGSSST